MVISHAHRYLFIEIPQTASTALAAELVKHYDGHRILRKHTDYGEFLRGASAAERQYRVLATVRNPLDIVVSKFVKARDDHGHHYADRKPREAPWGFRFRPEARESAFIARHGADFDAFVRKFYRRTYNNRACLLPAHAHVLRYESLNEDFATWLRMSELPVAGPIPRRNPTEGRKRDFTDWYTGDLRLHAARIFGPYLRQWGYALPSDWPETKVTGFDNFVFRSDAVLRRFYLRRIHYGWIMPRTSRSDPASGGE